MRELSTIIAAHDRATDRGRRTALATVVHLEGSAYRRPGARMLVTDEGEAIGAISGGCLEGDALRKALAAITQSQAKLVTYDTTDEEDASIGVQLGCAGVIQVLFEPIDPHNPHNPVELLRLATARRGHAVVATLFSLRDRRGPQPGTRLLLLDDGHRLGDPTPTGHGPALLDDMQQTLVRRQSSFHHYEDSGTKPSAFLQYLQPPPRLVLVGAGNDAIPMMQIADTLGWEVHIVDGRSSHARPERFAAACQVLVSRPEDVLRQVPVDDRTAVVLMTHNYRYDLGMLRALLPLPLPYLGVLGPRRRLDRLLDELGRDGGTAAPEALVKLHGPTGLDIGAETAEEIALSVLAEVQAVFTDTPGGRLRDKAGAIHAPTPTRETRKP